VNWALAVCTILIVIGFRTSGALASAYGVAVTLTMVITAMLLHVVMIERWKWPAAAAWCVTTIFLLVDFALLGANLLFWPIVGAVLRSVIAIAGGAVAALYFGSLPATFIVLALALFVSGTVPLLAVRKKYWVL
jgi:K+ transporter